MFLASEEQVHLNKLKPLNGEHTLLPSKGKREKFLQS